MSQYKVLVIDDSATIRRLVDTTLGPVGYRVAMAPTAEDGVAMAKELLPDVIILDHQLPGTTGVDVCQQLLVDPAVKNIPIIASSTLRKKAYIEYADCPNVVDMLPKPYTGELLVTTVANVLDTASMVVDSQRDGTAVPEVMHALGDVALAGDFSQFSPRAVLDFLNNARSQGVLEIEGGNRRVWVYLEGGHVQAVTATGVDIDRLVEELPESIQDLGPVLRLTLGGGSCSQIDGLVQLLDNKVLDPRLLQKLLRHQAATILLECFADHGLASFRFETERHPPALHRRLQLSTSLVALLVEGCLAAQGDSVPEYGDQQVFSRRAIRGQNLDRAGLSAQHQKLLSQLTEDTTLSDLATRMSCDRDEARRVLHAMLLADLVEVRTVANSHKVVVLDPDPKMTLNLRNASQAQDCPFSLKVVRDRLSLQLVLRRQSPDVVVIAVDHEVGQEAVGEFDETLSQFKWVAICDSQDAAAWESRCAAVVSRPYQTDDLFAAIQRASESLDQMSPAV